jgi:hypothetical protein
VISLFLSHSSSDAEAVGRIAAELKHAGYHGLFLDFDPDAGIPAGRKWEPEIYAHIRKADAVLFFNTPTSRRSPWCFAELALARSIDIPVYDVVVAGGTRHPLLSDTQAIDFERDPVAGLQRLIADLRRNHFDPDATDWDPERPPYPGLEAFGSADAAVFFGRREETARMIDRLHDPRRTWPRPCARL